MNDRPQILHGNLNSAPLSLKGRQARPKNIELLWFRQVASVEVLRGSLATVATTCRRLIQNQGPQVSPDSADEPPV